MMLAPTPYRTEINGNNTIMLNLEPIHRHGLASAQGGFEWVGTIQAQRFRLQLAENVGGFWAEAWHFYANNRRADLECICAMLPCPRVSDEEVPRSALY
jgi:hypothetical protein